MSAQPKGRWQRFAAAMRRAFHVDPPGPATPTPEEAALVERIAEEIVRRRMGGAALVFLESSRPLAGMGAAAMHFLQPFASAVIRPHLWGVLTSFLERGGAAEYLCLRIEELQQRADAQPPHGGG